MSAVPKTATAVEERRDDERGGEAPGAEARASRGIVDAALPLMLLVLVGYAGVARILGDAYPFSTFSMYAGRHPTSPSRVLIKEPGGQVHEVSSYAALRCDGPLDVAADRCPSSEAFYYIPYVDREIVGYLREHPAAGDGGDPVELVRRVWRFPASGGPVSVEDCSLAQCRARR